ncbi:unnamed protein product [Nippostrongylus brasiliensis]|uniref:MADF domain-containing protein n=1 Tax=Nippostrongylus brasiliensis TaxID=27835 RepID=A0A0N4XQS7_NIPBR|nr:unnamed protein product [Nippostrongylus brasiliensis]
MKKTWKNLKDNYWRIRKMYESDPLKPRVWRFYQCLRFLERVNIDESKLNIHEPKPTSSKGNSIDTRISQILVEARQMQEHDHDGSGQVSSSEGDSNQGNDRKRIRKHPFRVHMNPSLVQISIPEIDRYINTRQKSSEGVEIYSIPAEHIEGKRFRTSTRFRVKVRLVADALTVELSEIWRETEAEYMEYIEQRLDDQTTSKQCVFLNCFYIYTIFTLDWIFFKTRLNHVFQTKLDSLCSQRLLISGEYLSQSSLTMANDQYEPATDLYGSCTDHRPLLTR